jgi:hypothetical protein
MCQNRCMPLLASTGTFVVAAVLTFSGTQVASTRRVLKPLKAAGALRGKGREDRPGLDELLKAVARRARSTWCRSLMDLLALLEGAAR